MVSINLGLNMLKSKVLKSREQSRDYNFYMHLDCKFCLWGFFFRVGCNVRVILAEDIIQGGLSCGLCLDTDFLVEMYQLKVERGFC